jgi:hypothetical protein
MPGLFFWSMLNGDSGDDLVRGFSDEPLQGVRYYSFIGWLPMMNGLSVTLLAGLHRLGVQLFFCVHELRQLR